MHFYYFWADLLLQAQGNSSFFAILLKCPILRGVFMHTIQEVSYWNLLFELTLTDRNIRARICLKVIVKFWDWEIWVSSTSLKKGTSGGLYRKCSDISKNLDLWSWIQLKGTCIGNLGARNDQNIMISNFFSWNEAVKVIQVLDFSFILMFWAVNFGL